jgi:hypothetical protein
MVHIGSSSNVSLGSSLRTRIPLFVQVEWSVDLASPVVLRYMLNVSFQNEQVDCCDHIFDSDSIGQNEGSLPQNSTCQREGLLSV